MAHPAQHEQLKDGKRTQPLVRRDTLSTDSQGTCPTLGFPKFQTSRDLEAWKSEIGTTQLQSCKLSYLEVAFSHSHRQCTPLFLLARTRTHEHLHEAVKTLLDRYSERIGGEIASGGWCLRPDLIQSCTANSLPARQREQSSFRSSGKATRRGIGEFVGGQAKACSPDCKMGLGQLAGVTTLVRPCRGGKCGKKGNP